MATLETITSLVSPSTSCVCPVDIAPRQQLLRKWSSLTVCADTFVRLAQRQACRSRVISTKISNSWTSGNWWKELRNSSKKLKLKWSDLMQPMPMWQILTNLWPIWWKRATNRQPSRYSGSSTNTIWMRRFWRSVASIWKKIWCQMCAVPKMISSQTSWSKATPRMEQIWDVRRGRKVREPLGVWVSVSSIWPINSLYQFWIPSQMSLE